MSYRSCRSQAHLQAVVLHSRLTPVDLPGDGEDGRRLSRSRRAVEEQVRDTRLGDELVDCVTE